ncbi:hypothetical protein ANHYDRO_00956 [Anaerococcus hydrogenalis DSM 7454]|uniref:Thymidylate kinase-like domain-containing protein n=1 Tax=Anaerococcus hydrogenalis DSM 7454 TaxID=561177 RepID=B6W8Q5_9FIRM|nr:hypothetical protein ANHYDRO_00956 [Anaerococcus hydrogenalis DSM 7454]
MILFTKKTYEGYIDLSKRFKDEIISIDANKSLDLVVNNCLDEIKTYLKEKK